MPELIKPLENLAKSNLEIALSYVDIARRGMPVEGAKILVSKVDIGYVIGFSQGVKALLGLRCLDGKAEYPVLRLDLPFEANSVTVSLEDEIYTIHRTSETFPKDKLSFETVKWEVIRDC